MNRQIELDRLRQTDRLIARAEMTLMEQIARFAEMQVSGRDTALAERTLRAFTGNLRSLQDHRELIATMIQQIDSGVFEPRGLDIRRPVPFAQSGGQLLFHL